MKCAPEIFPRTMDQMVEGLHGVEVIMDDVTVAGDETAHDTLQKFQGRALKWGLIPTESIRIGAVVEELKK